MFVATIVISWASTRWIEDPLRTNAWLSRSFLTTSLAVATSMAVLIGAGMLLRTDLDRQVAATEGNVAEALEGNAPVVPVHFRAGVWGLPRSRVPTIARVSPDLGLSSPNPPW